MIVKKSISFFLAFLGALSFCASAKAQLSVHQPTVREQVEKFAQVTRSQTSSNIDTLIYFSTATQKSVRVFRAANDSTKVLMNVYDSRNKLDLASLAPATKQSKNNQIIYSARGRNNRNYYAIVSMNNNSSRIEVRLVETDQNGREVLRETGFGDITVDIEA